MEEILGNILTYQSPNSKAGICNISFLRLFVAYSLSLLARRKVPICLDTCGAP